MTDEGKGPAATRPGPKLRYEIGERCWIYIGERYDSGKPRLTGGVVVASFTVPDDPTTYYIIRVSDPEWNHFEVRDALLMAADERGIIGATVLSQYEKHKGLGVFDDVRRDHRH